MEQINFEATDGVELNGFLYKAKGINENIILSIHGMGSNCFKKRETVIAKKTIENGFDYFCFNNRGSELARYLKKNVNGKKEKILAGTGYEDVLDGYYDIKGALLKLNKLGYKNIFVQGHSLGCTKILYTYRKLKEEGSFLLDNIKGLVLLSLVDINTVFI